MLVSSPVEVFNILRGQSICDRDTGVAYSIRNLVGSFF